MLVVRPLLAWFLAAAAVAEAANLRRGQRGLQTYTQSDDYYSVMLVRVNQARAAEGLPALCTNKKLQNAAQQHSDDQAANNYMDHTGTDGTSITDRVAQAGYDWSSVAENVAAGQPDVDSVMESWMNSPGHRENILGDYTMFGTAYAYSADSTFQHYWTQDFGTGDAEECDGGAIASESDSTTAALIESSEVEDTTSETEEPPESSCSGSQETTEAPCTDAPVVVVEETDAPVVVDEETEAPCTDVPVAVVEETEAPCTDAPAVVVEETNAPVVVDEETEAPCTDAPVVVVDRIPTDGSEREGEYGSQETDTPVVVVDPPEIGAGSEYGTEAPAIELPEDTTPVVVVDPPEIGTPGPATVYNPYGYGTPSAQIPENDTPTHEKDCDPAF
ncbi:hypothetical protein PHYPSEUDO_006011 [Phytophthora pseudosyringae]|uniref:SCP domain-containing protein n=1 Tax=Phytophthora pseudosyringae TaxID=221518 RepID=A0A8T1VK44_9STRA|nr:hypothetical protein PHYPSEUDO_006011 [Phytophthora pseudosyringae]